MEILRVLILYDRDGFKGFDNTSTYFTANIFHYLFRVLLIILAPQIKFKPVENLYIYYHHWQKMV